MELYKTIGSRIRELRKEAGVTQEEIAFKAKISTGFLSHIERGTKKASLETIGRLAQAMGVSMDKLCVPAVEKPGYKMKEEELFAKRLESLVRDKGDKYKKILLKVARYLAAQDVK